MSRNRFTLNRAGVRELLRSEELAAACAAHAQVIRDRAGEGFSMDTHTGRNRVNAMVYADSYPARRRCLKDNRLIKAVGK